MPLFAIILLLIACNWCDANSFLCQSFVEQTKSLEMYGERFKGLVPFQYCTEELDPIEASQVKQLKIGGCDCDIVTLAVDKLKSIRYFDISYSYGYESLDWLELKLDWLRAFNASHIDLMAIPSKLFSRTPRLVEIDLSHNKLQRIDANAFHAAPQLWSINLSYNRIWIVRFGAFDRLTDLEYLDLGSNLIKTLDFLSSVKKLKAIHVEENPIDEFYCLHSASLFMSWRNLNSFAGCNEFTAVQSNKYQAVLSTARGKHEIYCTHRSFDNLHNFVAGRNNFKNIDEMIECLGSHIVNMNLSGNLVGNWNAKTLQRFVRLQQLGLSETMIPFFDFNMISTQNAMQTLDISWNLLENVTNISSLRNFVSLQTLNIAGNRVRNVPKLIEALPPSIEYLDLSGNVVGKLNASTFQHINRLKTLKLSNTMLSMVDRNPFEPLVNLIHFDISHNNLKHIHFAVLSKTLNKLIRLNVAYCGIDEPLSIVQHLSQKIQALDLSGNIIGTAAHDRPFQTLRNLQYLNISNTDFILSDYNPFESMRNLRFLDISANNLENVNFSLISVLKQLFALRITHCHIRNATELTQHLGPTLIQLDLSGNSLDGTLNSRTFTSLNDLMYLDLSDTNLTDFDVDVLKYQNNPVELHLSNNKLHSIRGRTKLPHLTALNVKQNDLTNIDDLLHRLPHIQSVGVAKNRFSCAYLTQLMGKFPYIRFAGDSLEQKSTERCHT